jgi:glycosyltransferase involved in cell wall biosynthesis
MQGEAVRKKIFLAITKGAPYGGAQEYVYALATHLPEEQFDVSVICGVGDALPQKLEAAGLQVLRLPHLQRDISILAEIRSFFALIKILRAERPDVLHTNSSKMGFLGALAGRIAGVPHIVFTGHAWAFNESRPWLSRFFFYHLHWKTIFLSDVTIAVSEKTRRDVQGMWFVQSKIHVVRNGIGPIAFLDRTAARAELEKVSKGPFDTTDITIIGTISELHKNKGLDLLIQACQDLPEHVSVVIIGDGEEKASLTMLIQKLGLKEKVFLLGRIPEARQLLPAFDIFTLTSRTEALPYALLEAGSAGLPVLASRVGGIPEIIEDGVSGLLVEPKVESITTALHTLLLDPTLRQTLGTNLKQKIEKDFSMEQMVEKTIRFYTQGKE